MLNAPDAALVVIDFQERLLPQIPRAAEILPIAAKLIQFARELSLPILWTEQYRKGLGDTVPEIRAALQGYQPIEKLAFGCLGDAAFNKALLNAHRRQLILTGVEAHVCVMQTALRAREQGYEVFVVRDATASRHDAQCAAGLDRMARAGVELVTAEMAMFELLGAAGTPVFKKVLPLLK